MNEHVTPADVVRMANEIFDEEFVDYISTTDGSHQLIIHFPEILITNSVGDRHTLTDMYFRIIFKPAVRENDQWYLAISGTRGSFTLAEINSHYCHSHQPQNAIYTFDGFCLGSSSFGIQLQKTRMDPSGENWYLFLLSIRPYLAWESKEGGPYSYMKDIHYSQQIRTPDIENELKTLIPKIPLTAWNITDEFVINVDHPDVYNTFNEHSKLRGLINASASVADRIVRETEDQINSSGRGFMFKGQQIRKKIRHTVTTEGRTNISRELVDAYKNSLTQQLKQFNRNKVYEHLKQCKKKHVFGQIGVA